MFITRSPKHIGSEQKVKVAHSPFIQKIMDKLDARYENGLEKSGERLKTLPRIRLEKIFSGSETIQFAPMDYALATGYSKPIGTDAVISCVALGIIDGPNKKHAVAHLTPLTEVKLLRKMLSQFEGRELSIFLCEGPWNYGVLKRVYHSLSGLDIPKPTIIEPEAGLVLYEGGVYRIRTGQDGKRNYFDAALFRLSGQY